MTMLSDLFASPLLIFSLAFLLRLILLVYGMYQDAHSAFKYTDIDYFVFTDAARYLSKGRSPYDRATYRYTPLLAWILLPTTWGRWWFQFGKSLFAISDLVAGWALLLLAKKRGLDDKQALKYASVWLLNPMVATISTRGSSEGFLCVLVASLLWAFETKRLGLAGALLGFSVHFKIYPFIYGASMVWALESSSTTTPPTVYSNIADFLNRRRLTLLTTSLATLTLLNAIMYLIYGNPFIQHTFLHHVTRLDHRHNFSPYNVLLYLSSAMTSSGTAASRTPNFASLAFIPQILLSLLLIPLAMSKHDLPATLLAQTLAFVTFNKVVTSQYFLWYLIFLPLYLPHSSFFRRPRLGLAALAAWVLGQAVWLQQGYELEFLGRSTFFPGLWAAALVFFAVNCWILGIVVQDVVSGRTKREVRSGDKTGAIEQNDAVDKPDGNRENSADRLAAQSVKAKQRDGVQISTIDGSGTTTRRKKPGL